MCLFLPDTEQKNRSDRILIPSIPFSFCLSVSPYSRFYSLINDSWVKDTPLPSCDKEGRTVHSALRSQTVTSYYFWLGLEKEQR